MKLTTFFLAAITCMLASCSSQAQPIVVCVQPSDRVEVMQNCDAMAQPAEVIDVAQAVAIQAALPGPVVLWVGSKDQHDQTVSRFPAMLAEAAKYPGKFPWVYLFDEAGWCADSICAWRDEILVLQGAALAHSYGMRTLLTLLPDVILDPRFTVADINAFDGISIDVYPSIRPTKPDFGTCRFSDNLLENLFYCSVQKLRSAGFVGKIGYIWQGFGLVSDTNEQRMAYLALQRHAINNAVAMGADAVMAFGCYLGTGELLREPYLVPLCGTPYEYLVTP